MAKFAIAETPTAETPTVNIDPDVLRVAVENAKMLQPSAFISDNELIRQVTDMERPDGGGKLGAILISKVSQCTQCGSSLILRSDRPSHLALYTESIGTMAGLHYHKLCKNRSCKMVQYYGYTIKGDKSGLYYDKGWELLPYFVSSQETAFEMNFLKKMDAYLLIGQVSYRQKAEIYNYHYGYYNVKKQHSKLDAEKKANTQPQDTASTSDVLSLCVPPIASDDHSCDRYLRVAM